MIENPSWANAGFLLWDVAAIVIPFVPGSYMAKGARLGLKAAGKIDDIVDIVKTANRIDNVVDIVKTTNRIDNTIDAAKVLNRADDLTDAGKALIKQSDNYSDEFLQWINKGDADNVLYYGIKDGKPSYTGITKQPLDRRLYQHNRLGREFRFLDPQYTGLTRNQARALEQFGIKNGPANAMNIINSINPNSIFYNEAMQWATKYLGY